MTKKILLLGGSGFLGYKTAQKLKSDKNYTVSIGDVVRPLGDEIKFFNTDVLDSSSVDYVIKNHDIIINFTGQITSPINVCFRINTEGINNIIKSVVQNNKKIVQISTIAIYGTAVYANENSQINPENPYATCKAFAEYQIKNAIVGNRHCILRISNLYGENQLKGLLAYLRKSFLADKKLEFNNNGRLIRYFLHVDDCAEAIKKTLDKNLTDTYNLSSNEKYGIGELIEMIEKLTLTKYSTSFGSINLGENIDSLDSSAFTIATGFQCKFDMSSFVKSQFALIP